jgi:hypothetical protein
MLATALVAVMGLIISPRSASAQATPAAAACCTYTTFVGGAYPPSCYPFKVLTKWSTGFHSFPVGGPGTYTNPVPPPCPPSPVFSWASFDGGITNYPLGFTGFVTINGCVRNVTIQLDQNGCVQIKIG